MVMTWPHHHTCTESSSRLDRERDQTACEPEVCPQKNWGLLAGDSEVIFHAAIPSWLVSTRTYASLDAPHCFLALARMEFREAA